MKVVLYSTGCPKCQVLEKKLTQKGIDFIVDMDIDKIVQLGFKSAPILEVEGQYMKFADANKYVNDWS